MIKEKLENNCKDTYDDDKTNDATGELHKLGVIGFEFEKIYDQRQYKHIS